MATVTAAQGSGVDFRAIAESIVSTRFNFDPLGLVSGYKSYLIYSDLSAKSDEELAEMGLTRQDIPRVAIEAVCR